MTSTAMVAPQFEIGRVLSTTFSIIGRNLPTLIAIGVIAQVPSSINSWFIVHDTRVSSNPFAIFSWPEVLLTFFVPCGLAVWGYFVRAALAIGVFAALRGEPISISQCVSATVRSAGSIAIMAVISSIAILGGFALLVVPGVTLTLMWAVIVPALMNESGTVRQAFDRSSELTRGHRAALFGLLVMYVTALVALRFLVVRPVSGIGLRHHTEIAMATYVALNGLTELVANLVSGVGAAVIYCELCNLKEGPAAEQLAAVFS